MKTSKLISVSILLIFTSSANAQLVKSTQLYVGKAASNNGTVSTFDQPLGGNADPIGFSIDDASATPDTDYVRIYEGNDTQNNKVVSSNPNHLGSTTAAGFLSKKAIAGGKLVREGNVPGCNEGEATLSTMHKGCTTKVLGYTLPQNTK